MTQYLLAMYQPDGVVPPPEYLETVMAQLEALNQEIRDAGAWVFTGGLRPAGDAAVLRMQDGEVMTTDGPYIEGKEHLGGFWIVDVPDRAAAVAWADRATRVTTLPTEVWPFQTME
ncbi:YciI family protein [Leifsonia kafniensis]|uniref:YciI family protein n=1 Tax=Leifsonia kafniensis TaxID=475957 RepID=A0ABP7K9L0_9MICO